MGTLSARLRTEAQRVSDDRVDRAVGVDRQRVLASSNVALIGAMQAEGFQVPDQIPVAGTWLGKGADPAGVQKGDQRATAALGVG
jgi:hypothetical protein